MTEPEPNLLERLEKSKRDLQDLDEAIREGDIDPRVLREFRDAVDHIRLTAWAVQQWIEKQAQKGDVYSVLPLLAAERLRRATQLNHNLTGDLDAAEITIETEGLEQLQKSVEGLHNRLAPLFKKR